MVLRVIDGKVPDDGVALDVGIADLGESQLRQARLAVDGSGDGAGSGNAFVGQEGLRKGVHPGAHLAVQGEEGILAGHVRGCPLNVYLGTHDIYKHAVQVQVQLQVLVRIGVDVQRHLAATAQPFIIDIGVRHLQMRLDAGEVVLRQNPIRMRFQVQHGVGLHFLQDGEVGLVFGQQVAQGAFFDGGIGLNVGAVLPEDDVAVAFQVDGGDFQP